LKKTPNPRSVAEHEDLPVEQPTKFDCSIRTQAVAWSAPKNPVNPQTVSLLSLLDAGAYAMHCKNLPK